MTNPKSPQGYKHPKPTSNMRQHLLHKEEASYNQVMILLVSFMHQLCIKRNIMNKILRAPKGEENSNHVQT
jgi:hypothetical protein